MSQFINLSEAKNKTVEGNFTSFTKRELSLNNEPKKFYYTIIFSDGTELILFHAVLTNLLKEAVKQDLIKPGSRLLIRQGEKIEGSKNEYYEYFLIIDGTPFLGFTAMSPKDFLGDY